LTAAAPARAGAAAVRLNLPDRNQDPGATLESRLGPELMGGRIRVRTAGQKTPGRL